LGYLGGGFEDSLSNEWHQLVGGNDEKGNTKKKTPRLSSLLFRLFVLNIKIACVVFSLSLLFSFTHILKKFQSSLLTLLMLLTQPRPSTFYLLPSPFYLLPSPFFLLPSTFFLLLPSSLFSRQTPPTLSLLLLTLLKNCCEWCERFDKAEWRMADGGWRDRGYLCVRASGVSGMQWNGMRCGVVWCGVVWCGVVWCGVIRVTEVGLSWRDI
jgi:hypothetical protein